MSTTTHELETVQIQGLKAALQDGGNVGIYNKATCSTAGGTAAKVTNTVPKSFSLVSEATIFVKFTYTISVANATLKVGDNDAKPIYYRNAPLPANVVKAGDILTLRYNGAQFEVINSLGETYESKQAASGGTDLSLVTTGEKDTWNNMIPSSQKGASNGVASLDANGKVPSSQLQSYVDDVIEGYYKKADGKFYEESTYTTEITGESGKIYTDLSTNTTYRWSGTQFTQIKGDLAIGTTTGTAADGGIVNTHVNDSDIHVTLQDKSNWSGKQDALVFNTTYDATTNKVATMADVPAAQIQSDWNQSDTSSKDYIKNKPTLATVATSGSYNDLSNKPTIPTIEDFHEAVATLQSAPDETTLTYTRDGNTYNYKIGDEVRVADAEADEGYKFYKLYNITGTAPNQEAVWGGLGSGGGSVSVMGKIRVNLRAYVNDVLSQGTDLNGVVVTLTNTTNNVVVDTLTWAGTTLIFNDVTPMKAYSISVTAKTGYTQPAAQTIAELPFSADETLNFDYEADEYTASIQSNQGTDSGVSSAQITIAGTALSDGGTVKVAKGTTITPTASAINGYSSSVSVSGKTVTASYSTMILTVILASDTGEADLSNVTITITDTTDSATLSPFATKQYKIPSGHTYSVAVSNDVEGYGAPANVTGTATSGSYAADSVTMTYEEQKDFVDLGLSVKWAKGNICKNGSSYYVGEPTDKGCYYSWGNIVGHNKGEGYNFNSTTYNSTPGASLTANIASNDSAHDAALACLGTGYRMPTKAEFDELIDNCDVTWVTSYNGVAVAGRVFKSKKAGYTDAEIFIPASGYYSGTTLYNEGSHGYFWSSTYYSSSSAYYLLFNSSDVNTNVNYRYCGRSVRAVQ